MPRSNPGDFIQPDWPALLEAALTIEGSTGNLYNRLYNYSMGNRAFLMSQGVWPQPIATYKGWQAVNRHVKRGAKAKMIIRPITVKLKDELDEAGNPKTIQRFKPVRAVFPISDTEGEPLPDIELPTWSKARALGELGIKQVAFENFNGNVQGYSEWRTFAINPVAKYPIKTMMHELAHIVHGHTGEATDDPTVIHSRPLAEFEAEGTAHLAVNEVGEMTPEMASVSRAYIQGWLSGKTPPDTSIRRIFKATDTIVNAGREITRDNPADV